MQPSTSQLQPGRGRAIVAGLARAGAFDGLLEDMTELEHNLAQAQDRGDARRAHNMEVLLQALRARALEIERNELAPKRGSASFALSSRRELEKIWDLNDCAECKASPPCPRHLRVAFSAGCHPKAGLSVSFHRPSSFLHVHCAECGKHVVHVLVADTLPEEVLHAASAQPAHTDRSAPGGEEAGGPERR